ncbi:hypothetical protein P280DRAFT_482073 [Massarina eburnea CBS 473.64]|uniref:Uncharacterized protein n=1 Tax=Massarina eburnea CBS 473.64 TaxID=1395130 RepID=A0A6A6RUR8_9PLEO|nr:hypothetical protein P280DRAFT_482073 [Massarina eburnea CBS 473.64]
MRAQHPLEASLYANMDGPREMLARKNRVVRKAHEHEPVAKDTFEEDFVNYFAVVTGPKTADEISALRDAYDRDRGEFSAMLRSMKIANEFAICDEDAGIETMVEDSPPPTRCVSMPFKQLPGTVSGDVHPLVTSEELSCAGTDPQSASDAVIINQVGHGHYSTPATSVQSPEQAVACLPVPSFFECGKAWPAGPQPLSSLYDPAILYIGQVKASAKGNLFPLPKRDSVPRSMFEIAMKAKILSPKMPERWANVIPPNAVLKSFSITADPAVVCYRVKQIPNTSKTLDVNKLKALIGVRPVEDSPKVTSTNISSPDIAAIDPAIIYVKPKELDVNKLKSLIGVPTTGD